MITPSTIYWITRLDGLKNVELALISFAIIVPPISIVIFLMILDEIGISNKNMTIKTVFFALGIGCFLLIFFLLSFAFTPSSKEVAAMYVIPAIAHNKSVQQFPPAIIKILNKYGEKNYLEKGETK